MPLANKIVLFLGLLLLSAIVLGGVWLWQNGDALLAEFGAQARQSQEDGEREGQEFASRQCLEAAMERVGQCGALDMLCESTSTLYLGACLPETRDFPQFCANLPKGSDVMARIMWTVQTCADLGHANERCSRIIGEAPGTCAVLRNDRGHHGAADG